MSNKYIRTVRRKKGMIDLTQEGRLDWFANSLQEEEQARKERINSVEIDGSKIEQYDLPYPQSVPAFIGIYPKKESISWFEFLTSIDYKRVLSILRP